MARAHRALAAETPGLVTLVVPRHPERAPRIAEALASAGFHTERRSQGRPIGPETGIYLADTMGELGLWYRLAEVVFVGGSLAAKGGQNLLEPAKLGKPVLTGPDTRNFAQIAEEMRSAGALVKVADGEELAAQVGRLLADAGARAAMGRAAEAYATAQSGVLAEVLAALSPWLDRVEAKSARAEPSLI